MPLIKSTTESKKKEKNRVERTKISIRRVPKKKEREEPSDVRAGSFFSFRFSQSYVPVFCCLLFIYIFSYSVPCIFCAVLFQRVSYSNSRICMHLFKMRAGIDDERKKKSESSSSLLIFFSFFFIDGWNIPSACCFLFCLSTFLLDIDRA